MGIFGIAKRGFGKALKPRGPGVIRPKPTDRYGQPMKPKPIRPGKKDGGTIKRKYPDGGDIPRSLQKKPLPKDRDRNPKRDLKRPTPDQKGLQKLPKQVRNKMGYMKKGGKVKKFPDLTGDGKVTRADILKGRGVFKKGGKAKQLKRLGMSPGTVKKYMSPKETAYKAMRRLGDKGKK